ncbi:hypothetical protein G9464_05640 [Halostella sp. JP-L12]|uniref:hypothetical protein n=1 Tax=Halostella TaxID=1843185 RepID=UPI000EF80085|nr:MULTISPECIES: hypothetical protein [Halostella]NHN47080.1 hypothetical protein [Halostella sp. JP-L12]
MTREGAADAASALAVGAAAAALLRWRGVPFSPGAATAGAVGALAVECALLTRRERVRALWERPVVRRSATVAGVALAVALGLYGPGWTLWAALGGVGAYLAVLALVAVRRY